MSHSTTSREFAAFLCKASRWQLRVQKGLVKRGEGYRLRESGRQQRKGVAKEGTAEHQIRGVCDHSGSKSGQAGAWLKRGLTRGVKGKLV